MRRTKRNVVDRSATTDVVSQMECAIRYPQATLIGALIGGVVPWFARTLAHVEVPAAWSAGHHALTALMIAVILGCACFSALTVYKFGCAAFGDPKKALGFVLAIEGVMLVSTGSTSAVALAVLIVINALANGSVIALAREATCKQRASIARGAATRAQTRARRVAQPPVSVVDSAARPAKAPVALVHVPRWNPMQADVIDAEIVSEELMFS